MARALTECALAAGVVGILAIASTASMAQAPIGPTLPSPNGVYGGPYSEYGRGPAYGYDPNAVYAGGTYAGSDPDPNIRGALLREFGRRGI
jgi:hypothetical protein